MAPKQKEALTLKPLFDFFVRRYSIMQSSEEDSLVLINKIRFRAIELIEKANDLRKKVENSASIPEKEQALIQITEWTQEAGELNNQANELIFWFTRSAKYNGNKQKLNNTVDGLLIIFFLQFLEMLLPQATMY